MTTVEPTSQKIDLVKALKDSDQAEFAEHLAEQFKIARITHLEHVHNAPIKVKITYGADIYKVMEIITQYYERPKKAAVQIKKSNKE